jgi:hypothetical protein
MNLKIKSEYNNVATGLVLHLIRNNEEYRKMWLEQYPATENFVNNYVKNENCGCRPSILKQYKRDKFNADMMTVNFINTSDDFDFENYLKESPAQHLEGSVFAIPNTEAHYKDFLAALQQKNAQFNSFNTIQIKDKIILTFM